MKLFVRERKGIFAACLLLSLPCLALDLMSCDNRHSSGQDGSRAAAGGRGAAERAANNGAHLVDRARDTPRNPQPHYFLPNKPSESFARENKNKFRT